MKVVAFLPVKGNSERIPNKNIKILDGKPLFLHTLEKLMDCDFIDEVYLDSESPKILEMAFYLNCKTILRDKTLADNDTDGHKLFYNEIQQADADIYIQILATSPFIKTDTIKQGLEILKTSDEFDSAVLIRNEPLYLWENQQPLYDKKAIPNSFELKKSCIETMGLYIIKKESAFAYKRRFGENIYMLSASPEEAIDINDREDFELAEFISAGKREKINKQLHTLKNYLTSPMLSDILDELSLKTIIPDLKLNLPENKILGRVKTLKLRKIQQGEDVNGIYNAMNIYDYIVSGDIIAVENEAEDFAYFGELNANMALSKGAVGAVISGSTRDFSGVKRLNFPVFSKGNTCIDIKGRAVTESINQKITISGVEIFPDDYIFGDCEGITVIPAKHFEKILNMALKTISRENKIILQIIKGIVPQEKF